MPRQLPSPCRLATLRCSWGRMQWRSSWRKSSGPNKTSVSYLVSVRDWKSWSWPPFVLRPKLSDRQELLLAGFALFAAYFVMALAWPTLASLYLGQIPGAAGIGLISIVGMAFMQDLLPGRSWNRLCLCLGNTIDVGFLLSGLGTGLWANAFGTGHCSRLCAALCGLGAMILMVGRRRAA